MEPAIVPKASFSSGPCLRLLLLSLLIVDVDPGCFLPANSLQSEVSARGIIGVSLLLFVLVG